MAGILGTIVARITADTAGLQAGVKKAQGELGKLGSSMRSGINIAAKYSAAMAAAGAAVTAALVTKAFGAIDSQAKLARQLRATNKGLETLTRAGDLSGVSQDQVASAAKRLEVALGDAARGSGAAADAMKRLGLDYQQVAAMDVDQRIQTINQAIAEQIPVAERAKVQADLFGRGLGAAIGSIDADSLNRARNEVEKLGLAVSEVDSATIERLNDNLSTIRESFRGMINRLAVKLAPIIEVISEKLRTLVMETDGFKSAIDAAFKFGVKGAAWFADGLHGLRVVFKGLELVATGFGSVLATVFETATKAIFGLAANVNKAINAVIIQMNRIKGVEIGLLDTDVNEVGAVKFVTTLGDAMRERMRDVRGELHDLAMQPLPGDSIKKFMDDIAEASRKASEAAVGARAALIGEGPEGGGTAEDDGAAEAEEKRRESLSRQLQALREHFMSEAELETMRHHDRLVTLTDALESELVTADEYRALREQAEQQHQDRLSAIEIAGLTERQRFERMSMRQRVKTVTGELSSMFAGVAQHNRKAFEANKIAGIANAIVSAHEGISKTLAAYPYPINVGMAAAHGAAAFAQVSAIKSASFGGGSAPSIAGSTPATPVTPVTSGAPSGGGGRLTIEGIDPNSLFSGRQMRELAERLQEHLKDGGTLVFT